MYSVTNPGMSLSTVSRDSERRYVAVRGSSCVHSRRKVFWTGPHVSHSPQPDRKEESERDMRRLFCSSLASSARERCWSASVRSSAGEERRKYDAATMAWMPRMVIRRLLLRLLEGVDGDDKEALPEGMLL